MIADRFKFEIRHLGVDQWEVKRFVGYDNGCFDIHFTRSEVFYEKETAVQKVIRDIGPYLPISMKPIPGCLANLNSTDEHDIFVVYSPNPDATIRSILCTNFGALSTQPEVDLLSLIPF
jgi:hypothetical protein